MQWPIGEGIAFWLLGCAIAWLPLRQRGSLRIATMAALALVAAVLTLQGWIQYFLFLPPILMPLLMLSVFANSLKADRTPLVTLVAEAIRQDDMPAELKRYTKRVTQFWCLLFIAMSAAHAALAIFAEREIWSAYTNLYSYLIVGLIFFLEHHYHHLRYSQYWHPNFAQFLKGLIRVDYKSLLS